MKFFKKNKVDIIEVVRSFSQTKQLKQYEPVTGFASYKADVTGKSEKEVKEISEKLHELAEIDVQGVLNPQTASSRRATTLQLISRLKILEEKIKELKKRPEEKPF